MRIRTACLIAVMLAACAGAQGESGASAQPIGWSAAPAPARTGGASSGTDAATGGSTRTDAGAADAGAGAQKPPTPHFKPARPLGCEPVAGSVRFTTVGAPRSCRSLQSGAAPRAPAGAGGPTGIVAIGSADGFRAAFHCEAPPDVDFSAERLVAYSFVHDSNRTYSLAGAVRQRGELHLVFDIGTSCQGARPRAYRSVRLVALPRGDEPVRVAFCNKPHRCGPVP